MLVQPRFHKQTSEARVTFSTTSLPRRSGRKLATTELGSFRRRSRLVFTLSPSAANIGIHTTPKSHQAIVSTNQASVALVAKRREEATWFRLSSSSGQSATGQELCDSFQFLSERCAGNEKGYMMTRLLSPWHPYLLADLRTIAIRPRSCGFSCGFALFEVSGLSGAIY